MWFGLAQVAASDSITRESVGRYPLQRVQHTKSIQMKSKISLTNGREVAASLSTILMVFSIDNIFSCVYLTGKCSETVGTVGK